MKTLIVPTALLGGVAKDSFTLLSDPETIAEMFPQLRDVLEEMVSNTFGLDYDDTIELRTDGTIPTALVYWLDPDNLVHCH